MEACRQRIGPSHALQHPPRWVRHGLDLESWYRHVDDKTSPLIFKNTSCRRHEVQDLGQAWWRGLGWLPGAIPQQALDRALLPRLQPRVDHMGALHTGALQAV